MIELRPYQLEGIRRASTRDGYGLFMAPRTGKTITALNIAVVWKAKKILVICPKKAKEVWYKEVSDHFPNAFPGLEVITFGISSRFEDERKMDHWDMLIVDESHRIKERGSLQTKAVLKIAKRSSKRLILTGTFMGNGYEDLYSQLKVINPTLYPTWGSFSNQHLITVQRVVPGRSNSRGEPLEYSAIVGYKNLEKLDRILQEHTYQVERSDVTVSIRRNKYHRLQPEDLKPLYNQLKQNLFIEFPQGIVTAPIVLTKALKLHQMCGGKLKLDSGEVIDIPGPKPRFLYSLLEKASHPVVVVCKYRSEFELVEEQARRLGKTTMQISGKSKFRPGDQADIVILQPQSGLAIDLSFCGEMIIYSMDYSYLNWQQFLDRIVTMSKTHFKYTYLLIKGSIDELVLKCVTEKKSLQSVLKERQDYLQSLEDTIQ